MTLTAPLPVVNLDLAAAIRAGHHPVTHEVRLQPTMLLTPTSRRGDRATVDVGAWTQQLGFAQATIRRAIERTLDAVGVSIDDGAVGYDLHRFERHVALIGAWRPW